MKVFAGSKQKELEVGSMALMAGYTPIATLLLAILVPIFEPIGFSERTENTLFGFEYTPEVCILPENCPCVPFLSVPLLDAISRHTQKQGMPGWADRHAYWVLMICPSGS